MDQDGARRLFAEARVAVLATVTAQGHPHVVPCCFVLHGDSAFSAVDAKPKSTLALKRLSNIRANRRASLLVHRYADDWSQLWWVRADGSGRVVEDDDERAEALAQLSAKYPQYRETPPVGVVLAVDVDRWTSWP